MHAPEDQNTTPGKGGPSERTCPLCGTEIQRSLAKHIREDCDAN